MLSAATLKGKTERGQEGEEDAADDTDTGKRVRVDWARNIGEHALEIYHCPADPKTLVVVGTSLCHAAVASRFRGPRVSIRDLTV
jgi:hypothetical protein